MDILYIILPSSFARPGFDQRECSSLGNFGQLELRGRVRFAKLQFRVNIISISSGDPEIIAVW
jgi:hypothetical protein